MGLNKVCGTGRDGAGDLQGGPASLVYSYHVRGPAVCMAVHGLKRRRGQGLVSLLGRANRAFAVTLVAVVGVRAAMARVRELANGFSHGRLMVVGLRISLRVVVVVQNASWRCSRSTMDDRPGCAITSISTLSVSMGATRDGMPRPHPTLTGGAGRRHPCNRRQPSGVRAPTANALF